MKGLGIRHVLQQTGVFGRAGPVEQMASGARRQDQALEIKRPRLDQQTAPGVPGLGQMKAARVMTETFELAPHEFEMVSAREHQIVEAFLPAAGVAKRPAPRLAALIHGGYLAPFPASDQKRTLGAAARTDGFQSRPCSAKEV